MHPTWVILFALVQIWDTLDLEEIWELAQDSLFMATCTAEQKCDKDRVGFPDLRELIPPFM
jgi:hypothetical protein